MAEPEQQERNIDNAEGAEDDEASSPFDHPAFLPVLLWGLAVWFGYDGWINQDPGMLEHVTFNRWGFGILVVLGVYFTIQSIREVRARDGDSPGA
jgi:hypothetical protein